MRKTSFEAEKKRNIEGLGAVSMHIFLAAGRIGSPSTNVLHSEPAFRISLAILGIALLALILLAIGLAVFSKKPRKLVSQKRNLMRPNRKGNNRLARTKL